MLNKAQGKLLKTLAINKMHGNYKPILFALVFGLRFCWFRPVEKTKKLPKSKPHKRHPTVLLFSIWANNRYCQNVFAMILAKNWAVTP